MACNSIYCIQNTGLPSIDDTYEINGTYNGYDYWSGNTNGWVIYYSTGTTSQWCLSDTLGGICNLAGKTPCVSSCPDLSDTYFYSGVCPTPTPTPTNNCNVLDFNAIFDCDVSLTPTPTPTPSITPTMTPTPSSTSYCSTIDVEAIITRYTPTPTSTPTPTPTSSRTVVRPCRFEQPVIFDTINDEILCPNSIQFQDCYNGNMYYTTSTITNPTPGNITEFMVFEALVNEEYRCISYVGVNLDVIGIDNITLLSGPYGFSNLGDCVTCVQSVSATPTPTPTSTPTPTPTPTPSPSVSNTNWFKFRNCGQTSINTRYVVQPVLPISNLTLNNVFFDETNGICWELIAIISSQPTPPVNEANITITVNNNYFTSVKSTVYQTTTGNVEQTACEACNSDNFFGRS